MNDSKRVRTTDEKKHELIRHFVDCNKVSEAARKANLPYNVANKIITAFRNGKFWSVKRSHSDHNSQVEESKSGPEQPAQPEERPRSTTAHVLRRFLKQDFKRRQRLLNRQQLNDEQGRPP
jgi:hypothetical protein